MPLIRLENRASVGVAAHNGKGCIHNRQAERNGRHNQRNGGRAFYRAEDRNGCQHVADEHTAGIAHKDAGRVKVVADKADNAASQRRRNNGNRVKALLQRNKDDGNGGNSADTGRQPVKAVN